MGRSRQIVRHNPSLLSGRISQALAPVPKRPSTFIFCANRVNYLHRSTDRWSQMDFKDLLSWSAAFSNFGLLLTGIQICYKIKLRGTTKDITYVPFLASFCSGIMWTKYAVLTWDILLAATSIMAVVMQSLYMMWYYAYTREKRYFTRVLIYSFLCSCVILSYVKYFIADRDTAIYGLGLLCCGMSVSVYGSPLVSVVKVITEKSTECMTFSLCLGNFLVALQFFIYGYIIRDNYVKIPNGIGVILGMVQVSLFVCYPSKAKRTITYGPEAQSRIVTHDV